MLRSKKKRRRVKLIPLIGSFFLALTLAFSYLIFYHPPKAEAAWYNTSWAYRKLFTINDAKVSPTNHTTLTNFPVLVYMVDPSLESVGNGGYVALTSGADIVFTANDGVTLLHYEIVSYTPTTGAIQAFINISSLTYNGTNTFYMYYGNPSATGNTTANSEATWNSNFAAVFHLEQSGNGTAGEYIDSTANGNGMQGGGGTSTKVPAQDGGQIGYAQLFSGGQYTVKNTPVDMPTIQSTAQTYSAWYEVPFIPSSNSNIIVLDNGSSGNQLRFSSVNDTIGMYQWGAALTLAATTPPAAGSWHNVVWTHSGTTNTLYLDGVSAATSTTALQTGSPTELELGSYDTVPDEPFNGEIDEVEIANTAESLDWIDTEYNNQSSPSTFYSEGAQTYQNEPPAVPTLINPPAGATAVSIIPLFQLTTNDDNSNYIDYYIEVFSDPACTTLLNTIDESVSTSGWLNEDANGATAYSSGIVNSDSSVGTYQYPTPLNPNQTYSWEAKDIDPGGDDTFSALSACQSFTTAPSEVQIRGGTTINGGTTIQ